MLRPIVILTLLWLACAALAVGTLTVAIVTLAVWWPHSWSWYAHRLPPFLAIFLFSGPALVYFVMRIVVRHGPSVKSDASFLAGTFLNGIVSSTVSTMFTGELGGLGIAMSIVSWVLTLFILITMLYETYYTALYFGASPRAWNTSFRQLTARVKLPEGDNDTGAASASASEGPVPTHLDVPEGSEDSDDLPPDAPVPVITTAHGSVIQPYDLFMALRVLGAIFAAITLAGAILTFNSETYTPYQRRAYLIMTLVLGAVATAEHVHFLLRTLVLPSLSTSVLTDMFTLVLLCLYGVVVGVADLVTDFPALGVLAWLLALTMFVTFLFETIYTSLHFGKVLKHWIRSFRDLTTGVQLEDRYFEEHAN